MPELKCLLLPAGNAHLPVQVTMEDDLAALQGAVGGDIEMVYNNVLGDDVILVINEEGKLDDLEYNPLATSLVNGLMAAGDYIVGPALLCKWDPRDDEGSGLRDYQPSNAEIAAALL